MPKVTINGREIEVKEGTKLIDAFKASGNEIAHYCYHEGLSVAGCCRMCMVELDGVPRPQLACNTLVSDGMVATNQTEQIKESVKWVLDFHLINHPLDCPICDQAGECGLQEQYMKFGKYDPEMCEKKVKKKKVVDLGPTVVLDSERCILCSRCVRFTNEVTKTDELGIFNRGDRSEIGTFKGKPLDNNYTLNTVDICPVGALTSKDFRFRQRVWYLKNKPSVCNGCSTGCNINVYYNEEGVFRIKPIYNEEVNGHWMCDVGRDAFKFANRDKRLLKAKSGQRELEAGQAVLELGDKIKNCQPEEIALVLTGQYTNEEYAAILDTFVNKMGSKNVFHWQDEIEKADEFDGILFRGDRNPNTKGLQKAMKAFAINTNIKDLEAKAENYKYILVAGPENLDVYPSLQDKIQKFDKAKNLVWLTVAPIVGLSEEAIQIPQKSFIEKSGSFTNFNGVEQNFSSVVTLLSGALTLIDVSTLLIGEKININTHTSDLNRLKTNYFTQNRGQL